MKPFKKINRWVDLHTHSQKSDGSLSPSELINLSIKKELSVIALTDHDSVDGISEAREFILNHQENIQLINGIEMSVEHPTGTLHILGFHIDIDNPVLIKSLRKLKTIRTNRNDEILDRLSKIGLSIEADEMKIVTQNNESPGRPHIAKALVMKGYVDSIDQAFQKYLGKNKKAYVPKKLYSAEEAISLIHASHGKSFVAHPATLRLEGRDFGRYLDLLKDLGLDGIEVYAPLHSAKQIKHYRNVAQKRDLMISAGSDFHGSIKPEIELGICTANHRIEIAQISDALFRL